VADRRGSSPTVTRFPPAPTDGRALLLIVVVVTAGCGSFPVGTEQPTATETLTPVPVPDANDGLDGARGSLPPGVSSDGTLEVDRLARAHADTLAGTSYTETLARTVTVAGAPTTVRQSLRRVAVAGNATLVERAGSRLVLRETLYSDGEETYVRLSQENRTRVLAVDRTERIPGPAGTVSRFLDGVSVDVTRVERRGTVLYRLSGTSDGETPAADTPHGRRNVSDYAVTALVAPSGFVRELSVSYNRSVGSRPQRVRIAVEYTGLGATTVSRPAWVPADPSSNLNTTTPPPRFTGRPSLSP
jgi:hypothetical protein